MNVTFEDIVSIFEKTGVLSNLNNPKQLKGNTILTDEGFDSLDMVTIFFALEEEYKTKISDDDVPELNTIDRIINHINQSGKDVS